jgi:PAS domain S-box-containing protein
MNNLPNLLIVDDLKDNLVLLELLIRKFKVNLIKALSGSEALEKIRGIELALAIIDVRMPGMNGYELAFTMNEERSNGKVPVIFLTANHISESELFKGYNSGAVDYISKPVNVQILLSKINVFLELFSQKQTIIMETALLKSTAIELNTVNSALKESEEKYRSYIENASDGVFVADKTGRYIEVNAAACSITGYSKSELLEMSISDILTEQSYEDGFAHFRTVIETGKAKSDLMYRHKSGALCWWTVEAVKLSENRFLGFTKDITQRKQMEEALREYKVELEMQNSELLQAINKSRDASLKYSELYDFAPSGYFMLSPEKIILELNYSGAQILGKERSHLFGHNFSHFVSGDTQPVFDDFILDVFKGNAKKICEIMIDTDDSGSKYLHIEGIVAGNKEQCLINVVEITSRKQAEMAIKVSEEKYRTILNASPDGILLFDLNGIVTEVSEIGLELFGISNRNDMVGKNILRFVLSEDYNTLLEIFERATTEGLVQNAELKIKKKNQSVFSAEISITLIQGSDLEPLSFMVILRDISQRMKMATKQMHADRMASLGEMASGIAHEINQPLNIISVVMDKILFECARTNTVEVGLIKNKSERIFENIIRIRNIIDHIRAFSRSHDDYILIDFDINSSIRNAVLMIEEQFKHLGIRLDLILDKEIPQILGNTYKFEQVILNLLSNSKDAVIEMKSKHKEHPEMVIGIASYPEKQFIIVEVTDNGVGIKNKDINNIMLPFYTTKDEGKGTGLGLSICYQIIKEMDGTIEVTSEKLHGTKIKLILNSHKKK